MSYFPKFPIQKRPKSPEMRGRSRSCSPRVDSILYNSFAKRNKKFFILGHRYPFAQLHGILRRNRTALASSLSTGYDASQALREADRLLQVDFGLLEPHLPDVHAVEPGAAQIRPLQGGVRKHLRGNSRSRCRSAFSRLAPWKNACARQTPCKSMRRRSQPSNTVSEKFPPRIAKPVRLAPAKLLPLQCSPPSPR